MKLFQASAQRAKRRSWLRKNVFTVAEDAPLRPRLLVDVSVILRKDAGTGIQRVVRAVWMELRRRSGDRFDTVPVFATSTHGYCEAPIDFLEGNLPSCDLPPVRVSPGDKFLGLDLSAHLLPKYLPQLRSWRRSGVSIHLVVYDLLPISRPDWFNPTTSGHFRRWFKLLKKEADQAICISQQVADELRQRLAGRPEARRLAIGRLQMGANIEASRPSAGLCDDVRNVLARMRFRPAILMVGTIEPRKGYDAALAAFDFLWRTSPRTAPDLIIVGKPGWRTARLQEDIRSHPLFGKRLYWLDNVSDEGLRYFYQAARGLLVASRAEGFGLPLIEAAEHRLPVLARDLEVFHEQDLPNVTFFSDEQPQAFGRQILRLAEAPKPADLRPQASWKEAVDRLLDELGLAEAAFKEAGDEVRDVS